MIHNILAEAHEHGLNPADVYDAFAGNPRGYQLKWRYGAWVAAEVERQKPKSAPRGSRG